MHIALIDNPAGGSDYLGEILRVLCPGGQLVSLDFGKPESAWWRRLYFAWLRTTLPLLGWALMLQDKLDRAAQEFAEAIKAQPSFVQAQANLASAAANADATWLETQLCCCSRLVEVASSKAPWESNNAMTS